MAIPKRYFRRIVVDGIAYRWKFPRATIDVQDGWSWILVQRVEPAGALLRVVFLGRWHMSGPCGGYSRPVLPSEVAAVIRASLAAGWHADQPGKLFRFFAPREAAQSADSLERGGRIE